VLTLGSEKVRPRNHLRVLFEQRPPLTFGQPAPDTELDAIVQRVGAAFSYHRTVSAYDCGLALRRTAHKEFVGIGSAAKGLGDPGDPGLGLNAND